MTKTTFTASFGLVISLVQFVIPCAADSVPRFDAKTGQLSLPFINTPRGTFSATLQLDPVAVSQHIIQFNLLAIETVKSAVETSQSAYYNFSNSQLTLPYVVAPQGELRAVLQQGTAFANPNQLAYRVTALQPYVESKSVKIQECTIFPADNAWNTTIDKLPVNSRSNAWVNFIGANLNFHMDFGAGLWEGGKIGIPYNVVNNPSLAPSVVFFDNKEESDAGPYPIPTNPLIESGSDKHILILQLNTCSLYELFNVSKTGSSWTAYAGAIWNLRSNQLRKANWTSADGAGLPVLPGLVRYDEVASGTIAHAIRVTIPASSSYLWPARHYLAGMEKAINDTPPMGARFRLKAGFNTSRFPASLQVILKAMQRYGIIVADHGSPWFISGEPNESWDNELLRQLNTLKGSDFEAVDSSCMMVNPNSGQADLAKCGITP